MADQATTRRTERAKDQVLYSLNDHHTYSLVGNKKGWKKKDNYEKRKQKKFSSYFSWTSDFGGWDNHNPFRALQYVCLSRTKEP